MKRLLIVFISILSSVVTIAQNYDQQFKDAQKLFESRKYDKCFPVFLDLAQKGYKKVYGTLGRCYELGLGTTKDTEKMIKYYELALKEKEGWCAYLYGKYLENNGDLKKAKDSYIIAVENEPKHKSYAETAFFIGNYYKNGIAGEFNKKLAIKYYRLAAKSDTGELSQKATAIINELGGSVYELSDFRDRTDSLVRVTGRIKMGYKLYSKGRDYERGVPYRDIGMAFSCYLAAASKDEPRAQMKLGEMYNNKEYPIYSKKKSEQYYKLAIKSWTRLAEKNDAIAAQKLGKIYYEGLIVKPDKNEAKKWFVKGAGLDDPTSQMWLGIILLDEEEYKDALYWIEKSAYKNGGNGWSIYLAGRLYEEGRDGPNGNTIEADYKKAIQYYSRISHPRDPYTKYANEGLSRIKQKNNIDDSTIASFSRKQQTNTNSSVKKVNDNTFVIIIANENYQLESKVEYAINDGSQFVDCCKKVYNLPDNNVHFVKDATLNNIIGELDWLQRVCDAYRGEASVVFYYAGHGMPNESSGASYLLPVDGNSRILRTCFSLDELYDMLGKLSAKKVTVLMDACFSGAVRSGGMLASARGVAIKVKASAPVGNMIVLSVAQGNETAYKYDE